MEETIEAFEMLMQAGKIRYYGISSIRPNVIREYVSRSNIVSVMMQYSLLDRRPEESCLELLQKSSIGVLSRGSLASGLLLGKPPKPYLTHPTSDVQRVSNAITRVADAHRTITEVALQFVLGHQAITSAVVGIRSSEQLQVGVEAARGRPLS